jgi:hypothetical protein
MDTERLTPERGERTWRLFQYGWYANLVLFVMSLSAAVFFFYRMYQGYIAQQYYAVGTTMMMSCVLIACLLLMGAGISRYQARLEGQHLEIKLALKKIQEDIHAVQSQLERSPTND